MYSADLAIDYRVLVLEDGVLLRLADYRRYRLFLDTLDPARILPVW